MKSLRESFEGYGGAAKSACPLYVLVCDFLLQRNEKSAFSPSFSSFFRRNLKISPPRLLFHSLVLLHLSLIFTWNSRQNARLCRSQNACRIHFAQDSRCSLPVSLEPCFRAHRAPVAAHALLPRNWPFWGVEMMTFGGENGHFRGGKWPPGWPKPCGGGKQLRRQELKLQAVGVAAGFRAAGSAVGSSVSA